MKRFFLPLLTTLYLLLTIPTLQAASFTDVPESHPQFTAIETLRTKGVLQGYEDGTFKPNQPVKRVEALKMVMESNGLGPDDIVEGLEFSDVEVDSWYAPYLSKAYRTYIVRGNTDGTFTPAREVNKAEFVKMTINAFWQNTDKHKEPEFDIAADVPKDAWFAPYMSFGRTIGIIQADPADKLYPEKVLTRAECAEITYKMMIVDQGGEVQKNLSIAEARLVDVLIKLNHNDIDAALSLANEAVFYTEQALKAEPEEGLVKAAYKIAQGFQKLTQAYKAGLEGNHEELKKLVAEAKTLAGAAYNDDPSTQILGKKIKAEGDILLNQIEPPINTSDY